MLRGGPAYADATIRRPSTRHTAIPSRQSCPTGGVFERSLLPTISAFALRLLSNSVNLVLSPQRYLGQAKGDGYYFQKNLCLRRICSYTCNCRQPIAGYWLPFNGFIRCLFDGVLPVNIKIDLYYRERVR